MIESALQLRDIVAHAADGILIVDAAGVVRFANPASEALMGRAASELIGTHLGHPIVVDGSTEMGVLHKDGSVATVEMHATHIQWEGAPAVLASLRDISERIHSQVQIERLNSVLRASRSINQLIVRERDPAKLIQRACDLLVENRGYRGAWIAIGDGRSPPTAVAQTGLGQEVEPLGAALQLGARPPCVEECLASERGLALHHARRPACEGCTLSAACGDATALVARLSHGDDLLGLLGVSFSARPTADDEEQALLAEVADDIGFGLHGIETDRRRRESDEKLVSSEQRFRALFENSLAPIVIADSRGRYLDVNPAACALFGYGRERLVSMGVQDLVTLSPGSAGESYTEYDKAGKGQGEFAFVCANGEHRIALWSAAPIADGEHASVLQDVTELKASQQRLKEETERAQRYLDVAAVMLLGLDAEGKITLLNRRGYEVLGVDRQVELVGRDWFQFVPAGSRDEARGAHRAIVRGETEAPRLVESPLLTTAGEQRSVVWHNAVVKDEQGQTLGTLSSGEDVTELRALEAQIGQADRLATMGTLAAGVAHEINNPLSYVLYNLESLSEELPELLALVRRTLFKTRDTPLFQATAPDSADALRLMDPVELDGMLARFKDALSGTHRIREIARGLGTFSRIEQNPLVPVDLNAVVDVAANMAFNEIKYRSRLVKDFGKLPSVMASDGRLSQVFLNLLINAAHAIDEGDPQNNEIRVRTWAEAGEVCAEVSDTGSGISAANLDKLFDPFFTTKKIGSGSGLGLAISKSIIEGYDGSISVRTELGKGTSFTIRLPVRSEAAGVATAPAAASAEVPTIRGRILIVDDERGIRSAMARILRGHETVQAASGAEARRILERDQAFDLLLCDMMMSDVSGMDLHQWLAEVHPALARQVIFITGGAFTPRAREYLSQVENIRLEKPFDIANLKKIVADRIIIARQAKSS